jgi:hypothetical protein
MAILVGQEAEGASAAAAITAEIPQYLRLEVKATGTVTELKAKLSSAYTGKADLAICTDNGAAEVPGTVKGEAQVILAAETLVTITGLSVAVTKGTFVWLALETLTEGKYKFGAGAGNLRRGKTKHLKISEQTEWAAVVENKQPTSLWAVGTEEEGVKGKATGALLLTGTAKGTAAQVVAGKATGPLLLTGTAKGTAAQVVSGKATGALLLTGTSTGTTKAVVSAKATGPLLLTGTSKGSVAGALFGKASGAILLTGIATGITRSVVTGKASGALTLTGTSKASTQAVVSGTATGALIFTGTSKGSASGGEATRKVSIFVFED